MAFSPGTLPPQSIAPRPAHSTRGGRGGTAFRRWRSRGLSARLAPMHLDVLDLRAFYYRTPLGRSAQRLLQEAVRGLWPDTRALSVVGYGFAAPFLRPFL